MVKRPMFCYVFPYIGVEPKNRGGVCKTPPKRMVKFSMENLMNKRMVWGFFPIFLEISISTLYSGELLGPISTFKGLQQGV